MAQHKRAEVSRRVARIHGHVHAIKEMIDEGRPYSEIVQQVSAVRSALDSVVNVIISDLVEDCVARTRSKEPLESTLQELQAVVAASK